MKVCPPNHPHGKTLTCYGRHKCRCGDCKHANTVYHKKLGMSTLPRTVSGVGTIRRIRALQAIGWPLRMISEYAGYSHTGSLARILSRSPKVTQETADKIDKVYNQLSMTLGPSEQTRQYAEKQRWAPPMAWVDIDDPKARPVGMRGRK